MQGIKQRDSAEISVIQQIINGTKWIPSKLRQKGFENGLKIAASALSFVAARYSVYYHRQADEEGRDWDDAKCEILNQFEQDLEENFALYYGMEEK